MRSQSTSSTQDEGIALGFSRADIATAKVVVKMQVGKGLRKAPTDALILPRHHVEEWFNEEAVKFLKEQKAARQRPVAEI